ncbi:SURF1 family protein [Actinotalea fermentans]|uniref:SURF1-like protein n=1 Tax=Actinotalea fermentans TaxID=43671 RepID=A0A511YVD8_9CELL|nr:SURF1 family protein [Actinotalea fermentans]GEN79153.1 SURF1-like protein [Actinotalea fermentans]
MSLRRAASVMAVALLVAAGCVLAGIWQWTRHEDRSAAVALVSANYDAAPAALADVVGDGLQPGEVWRPVTVRGDYVGAAVLRNRPVSGTPAAHALGVLEVADGPWRGRLLVVDRGWFPAAEASAGRPVPQGTLDVVVRLRSAEPRAERDAPAGQVQAIAVDQVLEAAGLQGADVVPDAYGVVATEDGRVPDDVTPVPRPDADLGPHLSYAFQWWVFATGALVGGVVLLRREEAEGAASQVATADEGGTAEAGARVGTTVRATPPPSEGATRAARQQPPAAATRRPHRRRPTAEEEEDAILDAAEGRSGPLSPRS